MKTKMILIIAAGSFPLFSGGASQPTTLGLVGPSPMGRTTASQRGYLQVFSATETSIPVASDDPTLFHLPSSYGVYDEAGQMVKFVPNHWSNMDEWPEAAMLPPGNYRIRAESAADGLVNVPVVIQRGKTTVVQLDGNWWPPKQTATSEFVSLPDGTVVGWRGALAN
jgi:hypothetical protein